MSNENGKAIASMVLGIVSLILILFGGSVSLSNISIYNESKAVSICIIETYSSAKS